MQEQKPRQPCGRESSFSQYALGEMWLSEYSLGSERILMHVKTFEELKLFLSQNDWFEDGYVSELSNLELSKDGESTVKIRLGYQIKGSYKAGTRKTVREYLLCATGIKLWTFGPNTAFHPEHCIEGVEILEDVEGLGIEVDVPERIKLVCSELTCEGPFDINMTTKPWVSNWDLWIDVYGLNIPLPSEWIEWLEDFGFEVVWRYACGEAKPPEKVPYPDYSGWFLQQKNLVDSTSYGVFFMYLQTSDEKAYFHIENRDDSGEELWFAVTKVLISKGESTIRCGNCTFTGEQWLNYIKDGTLPF